MQEWLEVLKSPLDWIGFALLVLVFPVYHTLHPRLRRRFLHYATGKRFDRWTESWIRRLVENGQVIVGAQQARNTTMVASLLASSTLILMGFAANLVLSSANTDEGSLRIDPTGISLKVSLAFLVLAVSFSYFVSCLRRLGQFTIMLGADPELMDRTVGSAAGYLTEVFRLAIRAYTLGVRYLYAIFPIAFWIFDTWLFVLVTLVWGFKFIVIEDFAYLVKRRKRPHDDGTGSIIRRHGF